MNRTQIPWVKNTDNKTQGYSLNTMTGCLNHVNGICKGGNFPCYAYKLSLGRCHQADLEGEPVNERGNRDDSFFPRIHRGRFDQLYKAPKGAGIFVCDRSDLAADYWPEWCQERILQIAQNRPDVRLYLLTKQPQNLVKWSPFPPNCYVGVTVCNQAMFEDATKYLGKVKAKIKFISFEPYLESLTDTQLVVVETTTAFQWAIIGCQTKPVVYPPFEDVEYLVNACKVGKKAIYNKPPLSDVMNLHLEEMP